MSSTCACGACARSSGRTPRSKPCERPGTGLRRRSVELAWGAFAVANLAAMITWERWETIPFHFIWVSLTLVYGFRVWRTERMVGVLGAVTIATGTLIAFDVSHGTQEWAESTEVPLMGAMFLAMAWHARRLQHALAALALVALHRMERIIERLLLLAKSDQPDFVVLGPVDVESFLEDVFIRWSEVAPRSWRLGPLAAGTLQADAEMLRTALDALLENAIKYTEAPAEIELSSHADGRALVIDVRDRGRGISEDAIDRIFERFGRADVARTRTDGGAGLGLAIVDAIAKAHGGRCSVRTGGSGTTFSLLIPGFAGRVSTES